MKINIKALKKLIKKHKEINTLYEEGKPIPAKLTRKFFTFSSVEILPQKPDVEEIPLMPDNPEIPDKPKIIEIPDNKNGS
jgi:hypothetical protein